MNKIVARNFFNVFYPRQYKYPSTLDLISQPADKNNRKPTEKGSDSVILDQRVREFPDWYKPYTLNYFGHGYLFLMCGLIGLRKIK